MTIFRPCIDLHSGSVKQIVGGTLSEAFPLSLQTNHVSTRPAPYFASLYKRHSVTGGHVIMLGPGNEDAARSALKAWPKCLQIGGGINDSNAAQWIEAGASKVIITSFVFPAATFSKERLDSVLAALGGDQTKLVVDLSCRKTEDGWVVAMDKWQTLTDMVLSRETIGMLEGYCAEFLVHAADMEGLQKGIDEELVKKLGEWCSIPVTYAGGARSTADLRRVKELSKGKVDLTIGSALDIFGGQGCKLEDCVAWNREQFRRNTDQLWKFESRETHEPAFQR